MKKPGISYNTANSVMFLALSLAVLSVLLRGYQMLLAYSMDLSLFTISVYLESIVGRRKRRESSASGLLSSLQHIRILLTRSKLPISDALGRTAAISHDQQLSSALLEIRDRLRLGQDFSQAVGASTIPDRITHESMLRIAAAYSSNFDMALAIKDAYSLLFHEYLERMEKFYSSVQKFTSLGMVTGTIAPSFALFAIVGYSIMNTAYSSAFFPVLLFVVVLPFAFSALRLSYVDPYDR